MEKAAAQLAAQMLAGESERCLEGRQLGFPEAAGSFSETPPTPEATGAGVDTEPLMTLRRWEEKFGLTLSASFHGDLVGLVA